jgi:hypothetical protein
MQMEIKLLDAESKMQSDEVNEQLERWEEPNVKLEGEIKNCRRGNWTRVKNTRGKELVILARNKAKISHQESRGS